MSDRDHDWGLTSSDNILFSAQVNFVTASCVQARHAGVVLWVQAMLSLSLWRWIVIVKLLFNIISFLPSAAEAQSVTQSSDKEADMDSCSSTERDTLSESTLQADDTIGTNCPVSPPVAGVSQSTQNARNYQVVPYVSVVPEPLLEAERRFEFARREWVVEQRWNQIGLAAVVWEAVSFNRSITKVGRCVLLEV